MFYTVDILSSRKRGKLSRVWLAATLSERLFKQSVSNKDLVSLRIDAICVEILRMVTASGNEWKTRFSLYLSSQLMYGTVKLFSYQVTIFQASLLRVQHDLRPVDFSQQRKRKRTSSSLGNRTAEIDLPEAQPLEEVFKNLHLQADIHLLPEADLETVRAGRVRAYVKSPTFGILTDEEVDLFLTEEDWQLQTLLEQNLTELNEPIRYGADETNRRPLSPLRALKQRDFGETNGSKTIGDTTALEIVQDMTLRTPKKRQSRMTDVATPTKIRRRNLGAEMNAAADREIEDTRPIPPLDSIDDQETREAANIQSTVTDDQPTTHLPPDIPANRQEDSALPDDNEIHLESLQVETFATLRNRRARRIFVDESTTLLHTELARYIGNTLAHTILKERSTVVPARRRIIPAFSLLAIPTTFYRPTSRESLPTGSRYSEWATDLIPAFRLRTIGPFRTDDDHSTLAETVRAADSRMQQVPEEISSGLGRGIGTESSSRNKTTDEPSAAANPPAISRLAADDYQLPENGIDPSNIPNPPILEHTGDTDTVNMTDEPGANIGEINANLVSPDDRVIRAEANTMNVTSTSDPDTGDIDGFLPPKLRTRSTVKKTSHEKSTRSEAIVELFDSPTSFRSERSMQSEWTKPELQANLELLWHKSVGTETVKLIDLVSPENANKLDAAVCFTLLLELHQSRIVNLVQAEPYGDIYIYKSASRRRKP